MLVCTLLANGSRSHVQEPVVGWEKVNIVFFSEVADEIVTYVGPFVVFKVVALLIDFEIAELADPFLLVVLVYAKGIERVRFFLLIERVL